MALPDAARAISATCPRCAGPVASGDVNIAQGVALCRGCGGLLPLAELAASPVDPMLAAHPPAGCRIDDRGGEIVVTASLASVKGFLVALALAVFWNGITWFFVGAGVLGLYLNLVGPLPAWCPVPESNGRPVGLGFSIFACLFMIPFVLVGLAMAWATVLSAAGRVTVTLRADEGTVWTGAGGFGRTLRFAPSQVTGVRMARRRPRRPLEEDDAPTPPICIDAGGPPVRFGSMLTDEARAWMASALWLLLVKPAASQAA